MSMKLRTVLVAGVVVAMGFSAPASHGSERFKNLSALLDQQIDMKDFLSPMPLKEWIGLLYDKLAAQGKELPILVDWAAFHSENPKEYETPEELYNVQINPFVAVEEKNIKMSVAEILRLALSQIPTKNAIFVIGRDHVEITTRAAEDPQRLLDKRVAAVFDKRPLEAALAELSQSTRATIVLDNRVGDKAQKPVSAIFRTRVSVKAAVQMLAEMADLDAVVMDNALFVTTTQNAERLRKEMPTKKEKASADK
jgi:hypothetical protein